MTKYILHGGETSRQSPDNKHQNYLLHHLTSSMRFAPGWRQMLT
jgi:hypothetical protein